MNDERRNYSRISFASAAQLRVGEQQWAVRVLDLSLRGALVRLPGGAEVQPGASCLLRVRLDEACAGSEGVEAGEQICMDSSVAHVHGDLAGLTCRSIDIDSVTHLRRLVELNLGDADLLQRELSALLAE